MVLQKLTNIYSGDWDGQSRGRGQKQQRLDVKADCNWHLKKKEESNWHLHHIYICFPSQKYDLCETVDCLMHHRL